MPRRGSSSSQAQATQGMHMFLVMRNWVLERLRSVRWMNLPNRLGGTEMTVEPKWRIYFELWMQSTVVLF